MKKADVIIILFFTVLCAVLFALTFFQKGEVKAVIIVDGEQVSEVELSEIEKEYTKSFSSCTLKFEKNAVSFVSSNCKDRLCIKHGKLSKKGDTMACIPNKVVVTIKGSEEKIDAVAY